MNEHWLDVWEREEDDRGILRARSFAEPPNPLAEFSTDELLREIARRHPDLVAWARRIVSP